MQKEYVIYFKPMVYAGNSVLSNGGAKRGLPISCFLNTVQDSLDGILSTWSENVWLASNGGIGTYWGKLGQLEKKLKNLVKPLESYLLLGNGFANISNITRIVEKGVSSMLP